MPPEEGEKSAGEFLFNCGMFHDAGKLYFLDTINLFARSLFSEEFDLIKLHPVMGWELLNKRESTKPYAEAHFIIIFGTLKRADIPGSTPIKEMIMPFFIRLLPVQTVWMQLRIQ